MDTKKYFHEDDPTIVNTADAAALEKDAESLEHVEAVSYTHLPLPTIYSV